VRVDNHPVWGWTVNPKLSTLVKLPLNHAIRASAGRAFREPTLSQLYRPVFRHSGYFLRGNEDLKPESAWGWNVEFEQILGKIVHANVGYFQYELEDMIYPEIVDENYQGGFPLMSYVNLKRARISGAEGQVQIFPWQYMRLALNYTWTKTYDLDENLALGTVPEHSAGARVFVDYEPWGLGGYVSAAYQSQRDYIGMGGNWYTAEPKWITAARIYKQLFKHVEIGFRVQNWLGYQWDREGDSDNDMPPTEYYGELKLWL
jgi:outer membrane receptor for ferrienterochelin and colicin